MYKGHTAIYTYNTRELRAKFNELTKETKGLE